MMYQYDEEPDLKLPAVSVRFVFDEIKKILDDYIPSHSGIPTEKIASKLELFMLELHMKVHIPKQ